MWKVAKHYMESHLLGYKLRRKHMKKERVLRKQMGVIRHALLGIV